MVGKFALRAVAICTLALAARAADSGKELLSDARNGDAARITALTSKSANLEARDKRGKTPLMLAAERGYADAVKLLLSKGASPAARDKSGLTAYGLALFSSQGPGRTAVLEALPKPARIRLNLQAAWLPDNLGSSCFLGKSELVSLVDGIHPDALLLGALADLARTEGRDVIEIVNATAVGRKSGADAFPAPAEPADARVTLSVRPGAACTRGSDNLTMASDVHVLRTGGASPIFEKTYGAGLKGLHTQPVTNATQYQPLYDKWAKSHADSIFWDALKALMRTGK
jgi:hypothetical protein